MVMDWEMPDWCEFVSGPFTVEIYPTENGGDAFDMYIKLRGMEGRGWKDLAERLNKEINGTPTPLQQLVYAIGSGDEGAVQRLWFDHNEVYTVLEYGYKIRSINDKKKINDLEWKINSARTLAELYSDIDPAFHRIASILNG